MFKNPIEGEYLTGVKVIDDEHRQLFDLLHDLAEFRTVFAFNRLLAMLGEHHITETTFMREHNFSAADIVRHAEAHTKLIDTIKVMCNDPGKCENAAEKVQKFYDIFLNHIKFDELSYIQKDIQVLK